MSVVRIQKKSSRFFDKQIYEKNIFCSSHYAWRKIQSQQTRFSICAKFLSKKEGFRKTTKHAIGKSRIYAYKNPQQLETQISIRHHFGWSNIHCNQRSFMFIYDASISLKQQRDCCLYWTSLLVTVDIHAQRVPKKQKTNIHPTIWTCIIAWNCEEQHSFCEFKCIELNVFVCCFPGQYLYAGFH